MNFAPNYPVYDPRALCELVARFCDPSGSFVPSFVRLGGANTLTVFMLEMLLELSLRWRRAQGRQLNLVPNAPSTSQDCRTSASPSL